MQITPDEVQKIRQKANKIKNSQFTQQNLPIFRPVPTLKSTALVCGLFAFVFLTIGILIKL